MPLHLLGKKSWNVYNTDNVERVRRDEAAAKAKEEAEEQRMQEIDAERRLAILRGEEPPPLPAAEEPAEEGVQPRDHIPGRERKKRKRTGEDDTDFELRVAKERSAVVQTANDNLRKTSSAPIVDRLGHIDLIGDERRHKSGKNEEAEKEKAKKKKEYEDQFTMRFTNAAGKEGLQGPWYVKADAGTAPADLEIPGKDVWGNEDPGRRKREAQRAVTNDPLAMMKSGAARVREVKKERLKAQEERERELKQLRKEERRRERRAKEEEESSRHRYRRRDDKTHDKDRRPRDEGSSRRLDRSPRRSDEDHRHRRHQQKLVP